MVWWLFKKPYPSIWKTAIFNSRSSSYWSYRLMILRESLFKQYFQGHFSMLNWFFWKWFSFKNTWLGAWSFQLLLCSPSTTGLALRFTLVREVYKNFTDHVQSHPGSWIQLYFDVLKKNVLLARSQNIMLNFCTFFVRGCWGQSMLLF